MKPMPDGPNKDDPVRLGSIRFDDLPDHPRRRLQDKALREALLSIPVGAHDGWHRYDTDDEHVLHLWADGQSFDLRLPIQESQKPPENDDPARYCIHHVRDTEECAECGLDFISEPPETENR